MHPKGFGNSFKQPTEGHWSLWSNVLLVLPPWQDPCTVPNIPAVFGLESAPAIVTQPFCVFLGIRFRLGWQSGVRRSGAAAEMETGLAAKGRDSQSTGSRFSGFPSDVRNEVGLCPCLVFLPNPLALEKARSSLGQHKEEADRLITELPPGHAEYMIKM